MAQQEPRMPTSPADTSAAPDIYDVFTSVYEDLCQERRLDQITPDRVCAIRAVSGDEDPFWRKQALTAMGWVAEKLPGLVGENWPIHAAWAVMNDPMYSVRKSAWAVFAPVLCAVPQQAVEDVLPLCSHESLREHVSAFWVLGSILESRPEICVSNAALRQIIGVSPDDGDQVVYASAKRMGVFCKTYDDLHRENEPNQITPDQISTIAAVVQHPDPFWRERAANAMGLVAQELPSLTEESWPISMAMLAMNDPDLNVRKMARKALVPVLAGVPWKRRTAQRTLDAVMPFFSDESPDKRVLAYGVLGVILGSVPQISPSNSLPIHSIIGAGLADDLCSVREAAELLEYNLQESMRSAKSPSYPCGSRNPSPYGPLFR
ncbi:MAG: hypothetical protein IPI58_06640 [Alphaproteobacteria bacterium]|nr:MAG: hypothetical protein IPI58_06640 [Alphaproteobacteria bacterium]